MREDSPPAHDSHDESSPPNESSTTPKLSPCDPLERHIIGDEGTEIMVFDNVHVHTSPTCFTVNFTYPTVDGAHTNTCRATVTCDDHVLTDRTFTNQPMLPFLTSEDTFSHPTNPPTETFPATGEVNSTDDSNSQIEYFFERLIRDVTDTLLCGSTFIETLTVVPENVFLGQLFTATAHMRTVQHTGIIFDTNTVCGWECVVAKRMGIWWHFVSPKHVGATYGVGETSLRKWILWEKENFPDITTREGEIFLNPRQHFHHQLQNYNRLANECRRTLPNATRNDDVPATLTENDFPPDAYQCLLTGHYLHKAVNILGDGSEALEKIVALKRANVDFPTPECEPEHHLTGM